MTKRWLTPEKAAEIHQKNRAAWLEQQKAAREPLPYSAVAEQMRLVREQYAKQGPGHYLPDRQPKPTKGRKRQPAALPAPSETSECYRFIAWTKFVHFHGEPLYERVVKIPNERGKSGVQTAILIGIGMRPGFPDYSIHAPAGKWHGLYLEAKKVRGGTVDPEQIVWRDKLRRWGYHCEICEGADAMIAATRRYFETAGCVTDGSWIDRTRGHALE